MEKDLFEFFLKKLEIDLGLTNGLVPYRDVLNVLKDNSDPTRKRLNIDNKALVIIEKSCLERLNHLFFSRLSQCEEWRPTSLSWTTNRLLNLDELSASQVDVSSFRPVEQRNCWSEAVANSRRRFARFHVQAGRVLCFCQTSSHRRPRSCPLQTLPQAGSRSVHRKLEREGLVHVQVSFSTLFSSSSTRNLSLCFDRHQRKLDRWDLIDSSKQPSMVKRDEIKSKLQSNEKIDDEPTSFLQPTMTRSFDEVRSSINQRTRWPSIFRFSWNNYSRNS